MSKKKTILKSLRSGVVVGLIGYGFIYIPLLRTENTFLDSSLTTSREENKRWKRAYRKEAVNNKTREDEFLNELIIRDEHIKKLTKQRDDAKDQEKIAKHAKETAEKALKAMQEEIKQFQLQLAADDSIFTFGDIVNEEKINRLDLWSKLRLYTNPKDNNDKCVEYPFLYLRVDSNKNGRQYKDGKKGGFCRSDGDTNVKVSFDALVKKIEEKRTANQ